MLGMFELPTSLVNPTTDFIKEQPFRQNHAEGRRRPAEKSVNQSSENRTSCELFKRARNTAIQYKKPTAKNDDRLVLKDSRDDRI